MSFVSRVFSCTSALFSIYATMAGREFRNTPVEIAWNFISASDQHYGRINIERDIARNLDKEQWHKRCSFTSLARVYATMQGRTYDIIIQIESYTPLRTVQLTITTRRFINNYSADDRSPGNLLHNLTFLRFRDNVNEIINTSHSCPSNLLYFLNTDFFDFFLS